MKNKIIFISLILSIAVFLPTVFVSAENTDKTENKASVSTENTTVASLQALIGQLQQQIKELQEQLAKLKTEVEEVKETLKLTKNLQKGLSDEEVKELQKFLSQYREIYPEGLITGYFGSLTEKAVKKFQEKYGIEPVGVVGPLTRNKINEALAEEAEEEKITICHVPLGNPTLKHTLTIGKLALEAHLAHGDAIGACETQPIAASPVPESAPTKPAAVPVESPTSTAPIAEKEKTVSIAPVSASSITQFVTLGGAAYKGQYTYGVTTDGSVLCWCAAVTTGGCDWKALEASGSASPVLCTLKDIAKISSGSPHSCAVKTDGSAICWGGNQFGELGNGTYSDDIETSPIPVLGLGPGTTADIAAGGNHTCALKKDGSVVCWGRNVSFSSGGQLGDGTNEPVRFTPTQVSGLGPGTTAVIFPDRSQRSGTCALKTNGSVVCWGETAPIGYSAHFTPIPVPDLIPGTVKYLSILRKGYCVLKTDDSVICAGRNLEGQLGGNVKIGNSDFTQVFGLTKGTTAAITPGIYHTCALKKDGSVICWGTNDRGQLGDGTIFFKYAPVSVLGLGTGTTAAISASSDSTCALKTDGLVVCWPMGTTKSTRVPILVPLVGQ